MAINMRLRRTNEELLRRAGKDPFELVNYAIGLGREAVIAGRGFHTRSPIQNQAFQILLEIDGGKDKLPAPVREEVVIEGDKIIEIND